MHLVEAIVGQIKLLQTGGQLFWEGRDRVLAEEKHFQGVKGREVTDSSAQLVSLQVESSEARKVSKAVHASDLVAVKDQFVESGRIEAWDVLEKVVVEKESLKSWKSCETLVELGRVQNLVILQVEIFDVGRNVGGYFGESLVLAEDASGCSAPAHTWAGSGHPTECDEQRFLKEKG